MEKLLPIHPGEILLEEFMNPRKLSIKKLAEETGISRELLVNIIKGKEAINEQVAIRLGRFFDTTPSFWVNLQNYYLEDADQIATFTIENRL